MPQYADKETPATTGVFCVCVEENRVHRHYA